jgi:hypothetical protein
VVVLFIVLLVIKIMDSYFLDKSVVILKLVKLVMVVEDVLIISAQLDVSSVLIIVVATNARFVMQMMDILFQEPFAAKVEMINFLTILVVVTVVLIFLKDVTAA